MLFVLSNELLPFCANDGGPELEGLQNLLLCARQGHHAITGSHALFSTLSKNINLSQRERATALSLANRRTELPLLEKQVKLKTFVKANVISKISKLQENCWEIDVRELKSKFLSSLVVLAENSIDAELYEKAAKHYQISMRINGVILRSSARGGGGSQIDVELNNLLSDGIPVFAITDGDFCFPGTPTSVISTRCNDLIAEQRGLGWHFSLPVREIENIVPHSVLLDVADPKNARNAYDSIQGLAHTAETVGASPCNFACLKKGYTLSKIFSCENAAERSYWIQIAEIIKHVRPAAFGACIDQSACESKSCACFVSVGFGEDVLKQVKKWILERSLHESLKSFSTSEVWMRVGAMIFDASIAFKPEKI